MNRLNIKELKHKSQTLQDIAADYLHLAQKAHSEVDTVRNARHAELLQLARQVELLSRIRVASQFSIPWRIIRPGRTGTKNSQRCDMGCGAGRLGHSA